jgi:hypothetical protein
VIIEVTRNLRLKAPHALGSLERVFRDVSFEVARDPAPGSVSRLTDVGLGTDATVVAAAIDARVDYFCTGDRRLRERIEATGGLKAVSPAELLDLLPDVPQ